jgi:hypothetical protein
MRRRDNHLFADGDLGATLRANLDRVGPAVDAISKDQLLATPLPDLIEHFTRELGGDPLVLLEDNMETTERETQVDVSGDPLRFFRDERGGPFYVPGHEVSIDIPFQGEDHFWKLRPSSWKSVYPRGDVLPSRGENPGVLRLTFAHPVDALDEERLGNEIRHELDLVRFFAAASASDVQSYNEQLRQAIEGAINGRKERIQKTEGIASRLGLPLKRNPDAPDVRPIKVERKLVRPLPLIQVGSYEPEYGIDDDVYEHILSVIRHEIATFEATPSTYLGLGEEDLRNILLAHLNGHYKGGATGETFRKGGKTDIRIEEENRAAFVAECKLWSGPKGLSMALDQLLGYLTWRDCKAALVVFNKNTKSFSSIVEKCPLELQAHSKFKRQLSAQKGPCEWRFSFASEHDELREVTVHVFLADLCVPNDA